jgi:RTA1 like protein
MGALWETLAFVTGALGAHNQQNVGFATAHSLLFLLAPLWINAFVYMTFSRLVYYILPEQKVGGIKASKLAKFFVWFDILSFIVQAAGGVMVSPGADANVIKIGIDVYMAGIGLQEAFILFFMFLMIRFHRRAITLEREGLVINRERRWRSLLFALYAVLLAITVCHLAFLSGKFVFRIMLIRVGQNHISHCRVRFRNQAFEPSAIP